MSKQKQIFMKAAVSFAVIILASIKIQAQTGEDLYKSVCASCHTINKGNLIGPDLSGIYNKRNMPWLTDFIRSSQKMIKSNDPDAVAIFNQYNRIPMPDNNFTDQQISSIIEYIRTVDEITAQATGQPDSTATASDSSLAAADIPGLMATDTIPVTDSIVEKGRLYFNGKIPFAGNSVACMTCHNINDGSLFGGGKLAINLTGSYTKLGSAGITAILTNPPFPAMKTATKGALTQEEIVALNSLLKSFAVKGFRADNFIGGVSFLVMGFLSALFLTAFLYLINDNRKIPRGIIVNTKTNKDELD